MPFNMWMNKWTGTVVYPLNGILFSSKKKYAIKTWKDVDESWMHFANLEKKQVWKFYNPYDPNYITFRKSQKYSNSKNDRGCLRVGRERWEGNAQGNFYGSNSIMYNNVRVDTCHYTFVETHITLR